MSDLADIGVDVSRETLAKMEAFAALLTRWNARINLVSPSTLPDLWTRHILDSAQIYAHAPPNAQHWVDLGSGGGLPAIICAILAQDSAPDLRFTLIESDRRKCVFLHTAARELGVPLRILTERAESALPQSADIVSARALAPLPQLLPLVARHLAPKGTALLPKGKNHASELAAARVDWQFEESSYPSQTDPSAKLLILKGIARV